MYQQIQSYPTPFLFLKTPPRNYIERLQSVLSLESMVLVLPLQRSVTEDFPPTATLSLESVNSIPPPGAITRSVTEDFPPTATIQLVSVVSILPINRSVTEDFPPTATLSLDSVFVVPPVTRNLNEDFPPTATLSLQSVVA